MLAHSPRLPRRALRAPRTWLSAIGLLCLGLISWLSFSSAGPERLDESVQDDALAEVGGSPEAPSGPAAASPPPTSDAASNQGYSLAEAPLVRRTLRLVENLYLEADELKPDALFIAGIEGMAHFARDALWVPAHGEVPGALMIGRRVLLLKPETLTKLTDLPDAFARVFTFYLQAREIEVEDIQIEYAAIRGMLSLLDRPSRLLIDDRLDDFKIRSRGTLSGIGCTLGMRQEEPTVVAINEGSPSAVAGLREGDKILRVDGESTVNMMLSEVVSRIRGPAGTWVSLDVRRSGADQSIPFKIMRDRIKIENVEAHRLPGDIGYVKITNFNDETLSNFRTRLDRIAPRGEGLKGLVIDLRGNGGGNLRQSAYMVDEFIESGVIVKTQGRSARAVQDLVREIAAQQPKIMPDAPLAVLVDRRTASGAEILAGALKYLDRAILVGQRTFGKGSVQKLYPLNDHASLKLTVARYILPGDHYIQTVGIQPDITLVPVVADDDGVRFLFPIDVEDEEDGDDGGKEASGPVAQREESADTVYFLEPPRDEKLELSRAERLMADFEVRFAADLLKAVPSPSRQTLLSQGLQHVHRVKGEQSKGLLTALQSRGLDWSAAVAASSAPPTPPGVAGSPASSGSTQPPVAAGIAQAQVKLVPGPEGLKAGEEASLRLEVTNTGTAPFYRLRALSDSDDPVLDGLEFLFGRVGPGETRTWPVKVPIPAGAPAGTRSVAFHFSAEGSRAPERFETGVAVVPGPAPLVELEATYEDRGPEGVAGTGNRLLEVGERIDVRLWVRNAGAGATGPLTVALRNPMGRDLELQTAKVVLDPIPPGGERETTLSFEVKHLPTGAGEQPRITLLVSDRGHNLRMTRDLEFGHPWTGRQQIVPPRLQLTTAIPGGPIPVGAFTLSGSVSDAQGIRQLTVYRDKKKIHRLLPALQAEKPVTVLPFRTDVALGPGANRLEVVSEDESGLITRQLFWVRADEAK